MDVQNLITQQIISSRNYRIAKLDISLLLTYCERNSLWYFPAKIAKALNAIKYHANLLGDRCQGIEKLLSLIIIFVRLCFNKFLNT